MEQMVKIYLGKEVENVNWDDVANGNLLKEYISPLILKGTKHFIENTQHEVGILIAESIAIPFTIGNEKKINSSYLVSFLSQYFDYTREEVLENDKYTAAQKRLAKIGIPLAKKVGKWMGMEKVIFLNNYILSTNLYPNINERTIKEIVISLKKEFPKHSIVFRSVNENTEAELLNILHKSGGIPLACRQLYMLDPSLKKYKKKRPFIIDRKHWEKTEDLEWRKAERLTAEEKEKIIQFYSDLYLKKYSALNPQYTTHFLEIALKSQVLDFYLLEEIKTKKLLAVQAVATKNKVITTPFIGYDQDEPLERGLYRIMNIQLTQLAVDQGFILNMSSGAAKFKKQRGGKPCFEYHVVFSDHLPKTRQWIWKGLYQFSEKTVKPSMIAMEV